MITIEQVHRALERIIRNKQEKALNYCINGAKAGLSIYSPEALSDQLLRVLGNMTNWRCETARVIRVTLKQYIKEN